MSSLLQAPVRPEYELPLQPFTEEQWANLNHQADVIYDDFTSKVAAGRKLPLAKVQENAQLRQQGEQDTSSSAPAANDYAPAADSAPPVGDMPAPPASALTEPPSGEGFQTVPSTPPQPSQTPDPTAPGSQP